jgi:hypothetical protein
MTTTRRTKPKRIIRPKNAWKRLGIGHSKFWADYIKTGKLKLVRLAMNASLDGALVLPDFGNPDRRTWPPYEVPFSVQYAESVAAFVGRARGRTT